VTTEGNGLNGLPGWIKAVAIVGMPSVVALILLGALLGIVPSPLQSIAALARSLSEHAALSIEIDQRQIQLLRQICRNTAKTEFSNDACNR